MEYLRGQDIWVVPNFFLYPLVGLALQWLHYGFALVLGFCAPAMWPYNRRRALFLCVAAVIIGAAPTLLFSAGPTRPSFLKGYTAKVQRTYDLPALQQWAVGVLAREDTVPEGIVGGEFDPAVVPAAIGVSPVFRFVSIVAAGRQGTRHIKLSYGGHFIDFWGLRVGPKTYRCPPSEWQFAIAPGICVWSQEEREFGLNK